VHLDAKVDIRPFLAQSLPESVTFIKDRVRVSWASYSQVEATLRMMRAALDSGHDFSHLVMLSAWITRSSPWRLCMSISTVIMATNSSALSTLPKHIIGSTSIITGFWRRIRLCHASWIVQYDTGLAAHFALF